MSFNNVYQHGLEDAENEIGKGYTRFSKGKSFVFGDEVYDSYCDGYNDGRAKKNEVYQSWSLTKKERRIIMSRDFYTIGKYSVIKIDLPNPSHLVRNYGWDESHQEYAIGYKLTERELLDKLHKSDLKYHYGPWGKILNHFYYGIEIDCIVESTIHSKNDCAIWVCKYRTNDLSRMPNSMLIVAGRSDNNDNYYDIIDYLKNKYRQYEVLDLGTLPTHVL